MNRGKWDEKGRKGEGKGQRRREWVSREIELRGVCIIGFRG